MVKLVDLALGVVLLAFAALQLNDPDPLFWVGLYVVCALGPLASILRPYSMSLLWLTIGYCLAAIVLTIEGGVEYLRHAGEEPLMQPMSTAKPYIEEAREVLGTVIAACIVAAHFLLHRPRTNSLPASNP